MSKYTEAITAAVKALEIAEKSHQIAAERLATVRGHAGQSGYSVSVNGVTVEVSTCDSRSYQGTLIRGREMIHLGALKALGAELQTATDRVRDCRAYLASIVIA
ncbi:hypothetical protein SAMN05216509_5313 [Pseudomonas sp. B10]|uniref:hypothetical protein n=1 Tax=Pseudomonas sp. B10 TaxID=118613 RepID=UPI0009538B45|nr:hypothetical protein [Pseudomonas sp. B10]SIR83833.1 hypothetical protein SAMN05216509_5313 [Pseudomonas sp. B10]